MCMFNNNHSSSYAVYVYALKTKSLSRHRLRLTRLLTKLSSRFLDRLRYLLLRPTARALGVGQAALPNLVLQEVVERQQVFIPKQVTLLRLSNLAVRNQLQPVLGRQVLLCSGDERTSLLKLQEGGVPHFKRRLHQLQRVIGHPSR